MTHHRGHGDPLISVLSAARRAGRPVPEGDPQHWQEIVRLARRRWSSFTRRHPAPAPDTRGARVEDLARGLLARWGAGMATVEISDCRMLARQLARVLGPEPGKGRGTDPAWGSR